MINAIFFDLYFTLVGYRPSPEQLQAMALKEIGISVSPEVLHRPLLAANDFLYRELARQPGNQRSAEDKRQLYLRYEEMILKGACIEASEQVVLGVLGRMRQFNPKVVLYEDVLPTLTDLAGRSLPLGLISNVERDISPLLTELGLATLLPIVVTSQDAGYSKPQPEIFHAALRQVGVTAATAMYVGDQYHIDIVGAVRAGMKGVLLDRDGDFPDVTDCPRIRSLTQVKEYLE
ncbi:MAG: HAD family hydrolase [Dehalococcoidales bacterium]|nr:HAD family hydrolase [Dehalococcoidales bacterium]